MFISRRMDKKAVVHTMEPTSFLSMEFSRQEYWSGLPFQSPRDLPNPGIEPVSAALQADSLPSEPEFFHKEEYSFLPPHTHLRQETKGQTQATQF